MIVDTLRTLEQNALMWARLGDIAKQVKWPVNGKEGYLEPEDWKDILSAELRKEQRIAQGISGGFVLLGMRTHRMKKREMSDLLEVIAAFGASKLVVWSEESETIGARE